jgi:hypothetical protein
MLLSFRSPLESRSALGNYGFRSKSGENDRLAVASLVKMTTWRGRFVYRVRGGNQAALEMAGSEWFLFQRLREIAAAGGALEYFESYGAPLVPRSLAALNCYLRTGAIRRWHSPRWDGNRELIGPGEWTRFCKMLALKFDGRGTRQAA